MKCQNLFSWKNKKKYIIDLSSAELAQKVVEAKKIFKKLVQNADIDIAALLTRRAMFASLQTVLIQGEGWGGVVGGGGGGGGGGITISRDLPDCRVCGHASMGCLSNVCFSHSALQIMIKIIVWMISFPVSVTWINFESSCTGHCFRLISFLNRCVYCVI